MEISVIGTGHTHFGQQDKSIGELMIEASEQALQNANIGIDNVGSVYISNFSSSFARQCHLGAVLAEGFKTSKEITRVEAACSAGGLALKQAALAILSGTCKIALVLGVEKMTSNTSEQVSQILSYAGSNIEAKHGATFPALYALMARRHFYEYGTTEEDLARIAVKNHKNAMNNPNAQFQKKVTIEDVLNSRYIASPLKLFDCAPISDGAAAIVLCKKQIAGNYDKSPIQMVGVGHDTTPIGLLDRPNLTSMPAVVKAGTQAFERAKLGTKDINVAELHDCFTIAELIEMEDLGFFKKGQAAEAVKNGRTEIKGDIPINTSGGLKAKGHPVGATGISQCVEIVKQLKGEAGSRQIPGAEKGLCCNVGGSGASAVVTIFSR